MHDPYQSHKQLSTWAIDNIKYLSNNTNGQWDHYKNTWENQAQRTEPIKINLNDIKIKKPANKMKTLSFNCSEIRNSFINNKINNEFFKDQINSSKESFIDTPNNKSIRKNRYIQLDDSIKQSCERMNDPN